MVLETWRPRNHPLIASKECKGSKECWPAACAIFAAFCAIYVRGAVVSRVVGKTATVATGGKAGPGREVGNAVIGDVHIPPDPGGLG
jgi:hypothetical protein